MSLQTRLSALITAIGADVKALQARTPTLLTPASSVADTLETDKAVEWRIGGSGTGQLIAKLVGKAPFESLVFLDRQELWLRVHNRAGTLTQDRMILDSNGFTNLVPPFVTALPTTGNGTGSAMLDGQECYYVPDATNFPGVVWHMKYHLATNRWLFVGGSPLVKTAPTFSAGGDTSPNGGAYLNTLSSGNASGPDIALTYAGDYMVTQSAYMRHGAASGVAYMSYSPPGNVAAIDDDALTIAMAAANLPDVRHSRVSKKTFANAGGTLRSMYRATGGSSVGLFDQRTLMVQPVRLIP